MNIQSGVMKYLRQITVEPVFFLVFVNFGLIAISNQDLYLKKACLVNLNYTEEVCDNLQNQTDVQTEVQKYVSQIQAYNGLLQSAPGVILALFAGPLTDTFGKLWNQKSSKEKTLNILYVLIFPNHFQVGSLSW